MKIVGLLVLVLGVAGALFLDKPDLRWESAGAAVAGLVWIVTSKR